MKSLIETMKEKLRKNFSENLILNLLYLTLSGGIIYIFFNEENYIESIKNGYIGLYFVLILLGGLFQKPPSDFKLKKEKGFKFYFGNISFMFLYVFLGNILCNSALIFHVNEKGEIYSEMYSILNKDSLDSNLMIKKDIAKEVKCFKYSNNEKWCELDLKNKTYYISEKNFINLANQESKFQMKLNINLDKNNREILPSEIIEFKKIQYTGFNFLTIFGFILNLWGVFLKTKDVLIQEKNVSRVLERLFSIKNVK